MTVQHTTHKGIRTTLHPSVLFQLKINERALRYNRLQHNIPTDTIHADTVHRRGNKYAHVYLTGIG